MTAIVKHTIRSKSGTCGHRSSGAAAQQPAAQAVPAQGRPGMVAGHGPGPGRGAAAADLAAVPPGGEGDPGRAAPGDGQAAALAVLLPRGHLAAAVGSLRAEDHPGSSWVSLPLGWLRDNGLAASYDENDLSSGLLMLICGDVIRPRMTWMVTRAHRHLAPVMAEVRDPSGFARLRELAESGPESALKDARLAATRIATILACKGGVVSDITVGDCVETGRHPTAGPLPRRPEEGRLLPPPARPRHLPRRRPGHDPRVRHGPGTADRRGTRRPLPAAVQAGPRPARGLPEGTAARPRLRQPGLDLTVPGRPVLGQDRGPVPGHRPRCGCRQRSRARGRKTCRRSSAASPAPTGTRTSSPGRGSTPRRS